MNNKVEVTAVEALKAMQKGAEVETATNSSRRYKLDGNSLLFFDYAEKWVLSKLTVNSLLSFNYYIVPAQRKFEIGDVVEYFSGVENTQKEVGYVTNVEWRHPYFQYQYMISPHWVSPNDYFYADYFYAMEDRLTLIRKAGGITNEG